VTGVQTCALPISPSPGEGEPNSRLFVVVSKSATEDALGALFRCYPGMEYLDLKRDRVTGRSKGYAYVNYMTPAAAAAAQAHLNGIEFPPGTGSRLKVLFAAPMSSLPRSRSEDDTHGGAPAPASSGGDGGVGGGGCGAVKNVLGLGAGIVEGLDLGHTAMAGLVAQGCAEIGWLAEKMGAKPATVSVSQVELEPTKGHASKANTGTSSSGRVSMSSNHFIKPAPTRIAARPCLRPAPACGPNAPRGRCPSRPRCRPAAGRSGCFAPPTKSSRRWP